ncbi:helix-turn-helix transcriptional regulator [Streptomyces sp. LaPpAH-108]|uniref:helix-turn-helix transcriptional regulator n=1 Tax=Streptomyces sp. LaPpAH-108 TaxID=1155714 RepID=UPI000367E78C|nr:LuxR C-terminal-related transcriptional regulator [Streptomyces sp. LaPpAH-108]
MEQSGPVGNIQVSDDPVIAVAEAASAPGRIALVALADLVGSPSFPQELTALRRLDALILVTKDDVASLRQFPELPGIGYLGPDELTSDGVREALSRMAAGEPPVPTWLVHDLLAAWRAAPEGRPSPRLTRREQQTLVLLVDGLSNKQIGRRLGISDHGAKRLVGNILAKLDCPNRTAVATLAVRDGLYEQCVRNVLPAERNI